MVETWTQTHHFLSQALISYFSHGRNKMPDKINLKNEELILPHSSRAQSMITGEPLWWDLEAAGHVSAAGDRRR